MSGEHNERFAANARLHAASGDHIFVGDSELARLMAAANWAETGIGPVESWPQSLRAALSICVGSSFPIAIYWGHELSLLYNDAWSPILGTKHPWALGRGAREVWPEIWDAIEPGFTQVMESGTSTYDEDSLLAMHRHGYTEECYFNFTFTPIRDEGGHVGGVFNAVIETTFQVLNARRSRVLRGLAEDMAGARSTLEACQAAVKSLATASFDVAFSAVYQVAAGTSTALLTASSGEFFGDAAAPMQIQLDDEHAVWPLRSNSGGHVAHVLDDLNQRLPVPLHGSQWPEPVSQAMVAPIMVGAESEPAAYLIIGASPRRAVDDDYRHFAEGLAGHLARTFNTVQAYEREKKRAEELAEIDRAKTTFFSNVSHEFRTPLTLMLGPTEDLLAGLYGKLAPEQQDQLETMQRNQLRLQRLVNTLLDFTRIESGRVEASYVETPLAALTADLASTFRSAIERAGLEFEVDCPQLAEDLFVDRDMWEQIVLNLLSNALKFTFIGKIRVALRLDEGHAVLQVKDTGVGVAADELPRLFERFHRIEGVRARTHEGSGIGLAMVKELVKLHGGQISANSAPDLGTTITVIIPRGCTHLPSERLANDDGCAPAAAPEGGCFAQEAMRWLPHGSPSLDAASSGATALERADDRPKILLVDDNADLRHYMHRLLAQRWRVEVAGDGEEALRALRLAPPDLVLTDVMMPRLDGFGLLRELRAAPSTHRIPVIMLSARAGEEATLEGLEAGADDYIIKPFSSKELLARVTTQLEVARLHRVIESERNRLHSLLVNAPAVVALVRGPEHIFSFTNELYSKLVDQRDVLGLPIRTAMPEVVEQGYLEILDDVYRTGKPMSFEEARVQLLDRAGDGSLREFFYNMLYQPYRGPNNSIEGVLIFGFDVSAQVRDRRQIQKAHAVAEEARQSSEAAVRVRDDFLSIASHELRTPLTSLSLQVDGALLALDGDADDCRQRLRAKLSHIRKATDRLELLIDAVLDGARLEAGRLELEVEVVNLGELAHAVCERFHDQAARAGSTIELIASKPVRGHWDPGRLDQVLTNLLSNAVRYGHGRPIRVRVDALSQRALLSVEDQGQGIEAKHQNRIFERFERASSDRNFGGMGLGLWSTRQAVEAMGGHITVDSMPGRGATFRVELPRDM